MMMEGGDESIADSYSGSSKSKLCWRASNDGHGLTILFLALFFDDIYARLGYSWM
jgi:hypothetical protein